MNISMHYLKENYLKENPEIDEISNEMFQLIERLYPICRSITGNGVRETLNIIKEYIPLEIQEIPTGMHVFDWTVPREWNIKDAYIKNSKGEKIVDFKQSNLHILNYSVPINKKMNLEILKEHLFTLPEYPEWIPYLTSYYKENWGFCLSHKQYIELEEDIYEVVIDSEIKEGHLTYGEFYIKGNSQEDVLFSCYTCHPSLCNDNLSGVILSTFLAKVLQSADLKYSYRFLFIPETIGAITWLSLNEDKIPNIKHGFVLTCVADPGKMTYKRTRDGNCMIDKIVKKILIESGEEYDIIDFDPADGSDERQFSSPGFNMAIGSLMRTVYGHFPEYHTSADNLSFIGTDFLNDSFKKYMKIIYILENNITYMNLNPKCEPRLGKRGLYRMIGERSVGIDESAILWVLNFSDGMNSLVDISIRSGLNFGEIKKAADVLLANNLLKIIR